VQYACEEHVKLLTEAGVRISVGRPGNPFHNAQAESFFRTLKWEEVNLTRSRNLKEATASSGCFIEQVCNRERLRSALGYLSSVELGHDPQTGRQGVLISTPWTVQSEGSTP